MLHFDEDKLIETANVIRAINPHAAAYPVASLVAHMKSSAQLAYPEGNGYVSTLGYVMTVWTDKDTGKRHVHPSIMPYTVAKALETGTIKTKKAR